MSSKTIIVAPVDTQDITVSREFNAPRALVYRTFADPTLFAQWMGCRDMTMQVEQYEFKDGGRYRYIDIHADGRQVGSHGVFHEVVAPQRIIQTFDYEGLPDSGHVILRTITFEAISAQCTMLVIHSVFQNMADRGGMMASGIEKGVDESHAKLDKLLHSLLND